MNKTYSVRLSTIVLILAIIGMVLFWGGTYTVRAGATSLPLKELRVFSDVYGRIKTSYVEEVDDGTLIEGAIDGMLEKLDPYSVYLKDNSYKDLKINTTGKFGGLGIEVNKEGDFINVISPIDDTPAQRAGIQPGDLITEIDGETVKELTLQEAVDKMRGEVGTKINLLILRKKDEEQFERLPIELTRAIIKVKNARHTLLEPGFGYVRIAKFQQRTSRELLAAINKLSEENKQPLQGLIVDLRNNPGGLLNEAVNVSDLFLPAQSPVVFTRGRIPGATVEYKTSSPDQTDDLPLVLLINGGSASASEIVAGALQDSKRATLLGTKSFGKGSVQTVHSFDEHNALKLTTAKYYTPSGRSIQDVGIVPDFEVEFEPLSEEQRAERDKLDRKDLKSLLSFDSQVKQALKELKLLAINQ